MKYLLLLLMLIPSVALAKVSYDGETNTLRITGPTNVSQVVKAQNFIREDTIEYIEMWGPGGSLEMGLSLGHAISKLEDVTVLIPKDKSCISACGFAALGASHVRVDGKLMLHRPFIIGAPTMRTLEETFAYMGRGYLLAAFYLEDMGYDRAVMENMMRYTTPCKFMVYRGIEIKEPSDLVGWHSDDTMCLLYQPGIRR